MMVVVLSLWRIELLLGVAAPSVLLSLEPGRALELWHEVGKQAGNPEAAAGERIWQLEAVGTHSNIVPS